MSDISKEEKKKLFNTVKHLLGVPVFDLEIEDDSFEIYLEVAIEDYSAYINNWLIEQQWAMLQNLELNTADITFALTTKTLDFERSFTQAYSKQTGQGTNAPSEWELKKDYVVVSANTQVYSIPANREINEILWFTPPTIDSSIADPFMVGSWTAGAFGWSSMGQAAQCMQPSYTLLLTAQDRSLKRRILQSELTYRITAGPNGTKNLYLYPIPGSSLELSSYDGKTVAGSKVWYFYYDTNTLGRNKCLEENNDIIKLPTDVPIKQLDWSDLNSVSKVRVRRLLLATTKMALGNIRGKFSGAIKAADAEMTMDYRLLFDAGEKERDDVFNEIKESLDKLTYKTMMEDKASIAENVNKVMGYIPPQYPIMPI